MAVDDWRSAYRCFRSAFAEAIDDRLHGIEHLDRLVESGAACFWSSDDAAIVAEIRTYPTGARVIHGLVAAGDLDGIKRLIATAEAWARAQGCFASIIESRPGWLKVLRDDGYRLHQQAIIKEL